ncbi:MAG TPA: hypothetical protein V6C96_02220 [Vampirovibrionales bacterium]
MSLSDLWEMIEGHQLDTREIYEASRLGAFLSVLPHLSKSDRQSLTPQKLFKFGWEEGVIKSAESIESDKNHFKKLRQLMKDGKVKPK